MISFVRYSYQLYIIALVFVKAHLNILSFTRSISGSPSKCIFKGTFGKGTGDEAAVVGCMGDEAVVNIAHDGGVSELTLRDGVTLEFVAEGDGDN